MRKFLPFESAILGAVGSALAPELRGLFDAQLAHVNKVQRLLNWNEIEFYSMRWLKVHWPRSILFQDRGEFVLGSGTLSAAGSSAVVTVWAVGGHVFSIESKAPLKQFETVKDVSFFLGASSK